MRRTRLAAVVYRVRQFFGALTAGALNQRDRALVRQSLSPAQRALFERMSPNDQQHAVAVVRTLIDAGWSDAELIQAALLHDAGKAAADIGLSYRVAVVLLRAFWPAGLNRLAATESGWRRPFHVHQRHPEIGAQLAAEAGSSGRVVELIRHHQHPGDGETITRELAALKRADESH